ncbi:MAG: prepilin-type N-terminal cleavage/methylation domain-containing protein [Armatimonadota bacterium]
MMKTSRYLYSYSGFTLIEIMITILIIGILLAIAVPAWVATRAHSQMRTCMSQLSKIEYAKEVWAMDNHKGKDDIANLNELYPDYMKVEPVCPAGGDYEVNALKTTPTCTKAADGHVLR